MRKVEYGVVTGYATSLNIVANDITYALNKIGHSAKTFNWQVQFYDAKNLFEKAIVVIPFDPLTCISWFLMAWDYAKVKIPVIMYVTVEGVPKEHHVKDWFRNGLRYIANSQYTMEMLEKVNVQVLDVIPHGLNLEDISRANPNKELLKSTLNCKMIFGVVCSSLGRKGLPMLSMVAEKVKDKLPDVKFYVYSTEDAMGLFEGLSNVYYDPRFGKLDRTQLLSLMASFDFYICPSHSEGFCMPVLESEALGVPVICGEYKPLTEITTDKTALYVPIYDVELRDDMFGMYFTYHMYRVDDMVERVVEAYDLYMNNRDKYDEMCSNARSFAKKFDAVKIYRKFTRWI